MKFILGFLICGSLAWAEKTPPNPSTIAPGAPPADQSFLAVYPQLKNYVYEEPPTGFFLGLGASPLGLLHSRLMFTGNFFELHWIKDRYDIEILNAAYGFTKAQTSEFASTAFTFRASPKYRFFGNISGGPLLGYELVSFPDVGAKIFRSPFIQPQSEPFSSRGWIYGVEFSETWTWGKNSLFKLTEVFYQETYSATTTDHGWTYRYDDSSLQNDQSNIAASTVMMLELSFLF
jgi:hypothetical protein